MKKNNISEFNKIKEWMEHERKYSLPEFLNSSMSNFDIFSGYLLAKYQDEKINRKEYQQLKDLNCDLFLEI